MMLEEKFKGLQVKVRGGGKLISHRPVFSADGSTLHIIQSSTIFSYSTKSHLLVSQYTTPGSVPIANIHVSDDNILIFTQTGLLITLEHPDRVVRTLQVDMSPSHWIPITSFTNFLCPKDEIPDYPHFLALGYPQDKALPVLYSVSTEDSTISKLCWSVLPTQHSVAMSKSGRFVVAIQEGSMYCKDMRDMDNCKWHSSGSRKFTCVAVHPGFEFVIATGDNSGRILIWNNVLVDKSPAKSVFHWHTLPLLDIGFSPEGSQMWSGGGESTLVMWDTGDSTNKRTIPRMGLPICHVSCSEDGQFVAVSHEDNCVNLVEGSRVTGVIKNFTWAVGAEEGVDYACGVNVDPGSGCLVLNGRPGWLQWYDFLGNRNVMDCDVAGQNYVTGERERVLGNSEVKIVGFSRDGGWMGTGEGRTSGGYLESRLKFWKRDKGKGVWVLNTSVEYPHDGEFRGLRFRPVVEDGELSGVSCGGKVFKVWGLVEIESGAEFWAAEHVKGFKDLDVGGCCYSSDGSLLSVAFGRVVTLWDVSCGGLVFKLSLCHQRLAGDITLMEFGEKVNSHVVVCCSHENVFAWDVISGLLLWVVPVKADCLGVDKRTGVFCFGRGVDLFFLSVESSEPIAVYRDVSKSGVKGVGFVGGGGRRGVPVFLNASGEICGLVKETGGDGKRDVLKVVEDDSRLTVFARMTAEKRVSGLEENAWGDRGRGGGGERAYSVLREIMDSSPHTMPSVKYYCSQLLKSLSTRSTDADRQAEMEKLVMGLGRKKMSSEEEKPVRVSKVNDNLNNSFDETSFSVDLDEVAGEDASWILEVFK